MKQLSLSVLLTMLLGGCGAASVAADLPTPGRDLYSDTWVATDDLGRSLPSIKEAGPPRAQRTVAMFYFLWHGRHIQGGPYDVTRILAEDPDAMQKPDSPLWGALHAPHHWGESIFGYYLTADAFVLRKHAQMLSDAGVDMVVFDVTNQITYRDDYMALLKVWSEVRAAGNRTPQVAFLTPFGDPNKVVLELWQDLYSQELYRDLWAQWEGRPLILADPGQLGRLPDQAEARHIRGFFTFRKPQPSYFTGPTGPDMWSWLEVYPQHVFANSRGDKEQMGVGVAQNAVGSRLGSMSETDAKGRSWHNGARDLTPGAVDHGFNFAEQWQRALAEDPQAIFITGWNEWIAGRFAEFNGVRLPVMFVDQYDQEHSRDIEPMRGGHGDNYYYQLIANIRRYKGVRQLAPVKPAAMTIDGNFADWEKIEPEFRDTVGDPVQRKHRGWDPQVTYENHTGRNDIVSARISADAVNLYCQAATREPLTEPADDKWMVLLLDVDGDSATGWLGYDFMVSPGAAVPLRRHVGPGFAWRDVGPVRWRQAGAQLELAVPWQELGLIRTPGSINFKWVDNLTFDGSWSDFTLNGDAAPNDRYNYRALLPEMPPTPAAQ